MNGSTSDPTTLHKYQVSTDCTLQPRPLNHLSNERTYLSYLRTSYTAYGLGLLILKYAINSNNTRYKVAGAVAIVLGILSTLYGTYRYKRVATKLEQGYYIVGNHAIEYGIMTCIVICVIVIVVVLV